MESSGRRKNGRNYVKLGLALVSFLSLFALYVEFLSYFAGPIFSAPMNTVESLIFYTMILRALGMAFVPSLKRLQAQVKILVFSFEAFVLCFLILEIVFTGDQYYSSLLATILTTWLGTTLIVLTPYSIYEFAIFMYRGTTVTSLVVSATPLVAISLFLSSLIVRVSSPPSGISNFGAGLINSLRGQPSVGGGNGLGSADSLGGVVSILFFLTMLTYVVSDLYDSAPMLAKTVPKYHYALALAVIGSLGVYLWTVLVSHAFKADVIVIFSVPAIIIPVILWIITRE